MLQPKFGQKSGFFGVQSDSAHWELRRCLGAGSKKGAVYGEDHHTVGGYGLVDLIGSLVDFGLSAKKLAFFGGS